MRWVQRRKEMQGFSLIELLIVVAIILIIAAIAIPNFIRSKMAANESAAVSYLRAISTATVSYSTTFISGFPPTLLQMGPGPGDCTGADLIDDLLALPPNTKSGYGFFYPNAGGVAPVNFTNPPAGCPAGVVNYGLQANPTAPGSTGQRFFFTDESAVIRFNNAGPATAADPPIS